MRTRAGAPGSPGRLGLVGGALTGVLGSDTPEKVAPHKLEIRRRPHQLLGSRDSPLHLIKDPAGGDASQGEPGGDPAREIGTEMGGDLRPGAMLGVKAHGLVNIGTDALNGLLLTADHGADSCSGGGRGGRTAVAADAQRSHGWNVARTGGLREGGHLIRGG